MEVIGRKDYIGDWYNRIMEKKCSECENPLFLSEMEWEDGFCEKCFEKIQSQN